MYIRLYRKENLLSRTEKRYLWLAEVNFRNCLSIIYMYTQRLYYDVSEFVPLPIIHDKLSVFLAGGSLGNVCLVTAPQESKAPRSNFTLFVLTVPNKFRIESWTWEIVMSKISIRIDIFKYQYNIKNSKEKRPGPSRLSVQLRIEIRWLNTRKKYEKTY